MGRKLTDSEVFGFSQVNSEHCRHKIFNGTFIIDGEEKPLSLFKLIKKTSEEHPNGIVSAYKDNVAFIKGPKVVQFAPKSPDKADFYTETNFESVISLKAETHNFPTTVEPFNGAATGSGGEIRDRLGRWKRIATIGRNRGLHDRLPSIERWRPDGVRSGQALGKRDAGAQMALPDPHGYSDQGLKRCLRLRQQIRTAFDLPEAY